MWVLVIPGRGAYFELPGRLEKHGRLKTWTKFCGQKTRTIKRSAWKFSFSKTWTILLRKVNVRFLNIRFNIRFSNVWTFERKAGRYGRYGRQKCMFSEKLSFFIWHLHGEDVGDSSNGGFGRFTYGWPYWKCFGNLTRRRHSGPHKHCTIINSRAPLQRRPPVTNLFFREGSPVFIQKYCRRNNEWCEYQYWWVPISFLPSFPINLTKTSLSWHAVSWSLEGRLIRQSWKLEEWRQENFILFNIS